MIVLKTFKNGVFGKLTTLTNPATGKVMFIGKEVAELWGHSNSRKAIKDAKLDIEELLVVKKSEHREFFKIVCNHGLLPEKANVIQLVSESGLYKMAMNSKLEQADKFKEWIAKEVLPSIRATGSYSINQGFVNMNKHTSVKFQKENSKAVNSLNYQIGGVPKIIEYSIESCLLHTNKTPSEIKEIGKNLGLKSSERTSAKEVLRKIRPAVACGMSFTDNIVKEGHSLEKIADISVRLAVPLFEELLKIGATPIELTQ